MSECDENLAAKYIFCSYAAVVKWFYYHYTDAL